MPTLQLTREINISRIEAYLNELKSEPLQDLLTYEQIEGASFGGEAAMIQLLFTWARHNPKGRLLLKSASTEPELSHYIDKYAKRAFGFVAMLMASDIFTSDDVDCRQLAYRACQSRVDQLINAAGPFRNRSESPLTVEHALSNAVYGHRTFLPCVDHSSKATIAPFYHPNGRFRERSEFRRFAEVLIGRRDNRFVDQNENSVRGLGSMLYELMHNTHDWATTDADGATLKKSIRGILFTHLYLSRASIRKAAGDNQSIAEYMSQVEDRNPGQSIHLAELSVFDAGPGLSARWLAGQDHQDVVSLETEHGACISCLGVHHTTSSDSYRGVGLFDVMQTLNSLSAMVRVRTGRLALFRDFIANPLTESELEDGPKLPLSPEHADHPDGLSPVVGTTFTILFPLK